MGELLGKQARHFLLLSATPHNGKEDDFQLFLALLDGDRFEGKYRQAVHTQTADDLMRRMIKEQLVKMDGTPLFPERQAYTMTYDLSRRRRELYDAVTNYVREEFNRAEQLDDESQAERRVRVDGVAAAVGVVAGGDLSVAGATARAVARRGWTRHGSVKRANDARALRMDLEPDGCWTISTMERRPISKRRKTSWPTGRRPR